MWLQRFESRPLLQTARFRFHVEDFCVKALLNWFLVAFVAAILPGILEIRAGAGELVASSTTKRTVWPVRIGRLDAGTRSA
jgi:hypothetical protein